jgi:hypothetical protein
VPFNPCGRGVDIMEDTVDDQIRPFSDSDIVVTRRWYRVPWGTPLLGFPTAFMSAHYEPFPWLGRTVGEVYPPKIRHTRNVVPPGMTFDHVCGTPEQFARGAKFDPAFNSHPDEYWIPRCCGRVVPPGQGVMEIGGECGDKFHGFDPTEGGVELGGASGDVIHGFDPTEGGVELGGAAGESRSFTDPTAGGVELGGAAGDQEERFDPTEGGVELGGAAGESRSFTDPTEGGVELGGASGNTQEYIDPTEGGVELGGAAGESRSFTDPTEGGVELGGASGDVIHGYDPTEGGVELGGASGDVIHGFDPTEGGVELGGASGDVFTPGTVTPGSSCATAGVIVLSTTYGATTPAFPGMDWWHTTGLTPGAAYKVYTTGVGGFGGAIMSSNSGAACPPSNTVTFSPGPPCWGFTAPADTFVWFQFQSPFGAIAYTFHVEAGSCP